MNKNIKLFEMFAGLGSQYKSLKNIYKNSNKDVISVGVCEFYIDAIISYMIIHYGLLKPENKLTKNQMVDILSKYTFSANSKDIVNSNYFNRFKEQKLRSYFSYLYAYLNNDYFNNRYKKREREREGGRENHTDIKRIVKLPKDIDILTYSFPCQDLSQQGKQRGINQNTRSGLLYEVERILKENTDRLPKILLLENVKALVSKKFIGDFEKWIDILDKIGYKSKYKVLNAANYGSLQNRERVFMVSILKSENIDFEFPSEEIQTKSKLNKIINNPYDGNNLNRLFNYKMNEFVKTKNNIIKSKLCDYTNFNSEAYIYKTDSLGPTLTASGANSRLKFYFEKEKIIRYINEIEAYQYMGFKLKDALKVKESKLVSPNKMIFTAGNSICVEVLEAIFKTIKDCYERQNLSNQ